jgi:ATP-binding cassette subfamily B protein
MQFINSNTSDLSKAIITEAGNLTNIINSFLLLLSEILVALLIYFILLYVNWKMTILLTAFLALNILFLIKTVSKEIKKSGEKREKFQRRFYKILNSSFGNFKLIKLKSKEKSVLDNFFESSVGFASANIKNQSLIYVPKYLLEAIGFSLVSFFVVYTVLKNHADIRNILPIISIFILGLYRLLPSANRILSNYNNIIFLNKSIDVVHDDIHQIPEVLGNEQINFNKEIILKNVSFGYSKNKPILNSINLNIKKGEKIAITGETGSGKSTLVDLIIGLLKPDQGDILIDDIKLNSQNIKSWRNKFGYIPQAIYLFDGTVAQNVVIGEYIIDEDKVKAVLKKANMLDFLEKHHEGIYTKVGEGGIKLSGGQKQRVAIARALYDDPEILVLDEATSSLDNKTESLVMDEIYEAGKDKTLIIIAHRLSTIERCDKVYKLEERKFFVL